MSENTAGYFDQPPQDHEGHYEKRPDGKWYLKDELVQACGTPYVQSPGAWVNMEDDKDVDLWGVQKEEGKVSALGVSLNSMAHPHLSLNPESLEEIEVDIVGDVNSKEKGSGARYNQDKPPMAYIPLDQQLRVFVHYDSLSPKLYDVLDELSLFERGTGSMASVLKILTPADLIQASYVWQFGAEKYAAWNWAKGMSWSIPLSCISRHTMAIMTGETFDPESGYTHWGHIVCNILMLDHYSRHYKEGDDRPPMELFRAE